MIGHLKGTIIAIAEDSLLLDVQGVGYELAGTARLLSRLGIGEAASLSIETMVREDFIRLYAFENEVERRCFRLLQTVQGVGAKAALAILQVLTPVQLLDAISVEDDVTIARAQGVGKKIATRICTELRGKTTGLMAAVSGHTGLAKTLDAPGEPTEEGVSANQGARADAVSALVNLGIDAMIARQAVGVVAKTHPDMNVQGLIKAALKEVALA